MIRAHTSRQPVCSDPTQSHLSQPLSLAGRRIRMHDIAYATNKRSTLVTASMPPAGRDGEPCAATAHDQQPGAQCGRYLRASLVLKAIPLLLRFGDIKGERDEFYVVYDQMAQKSRNRCLPPFPLEQSFGASAPATTRSAKTMSHIRSPCSGEVWRWAPKSSYFSRFSRHQAHHQNDYLPKGSLRRCRFSTIFFLRRDAAYQERDAEINGAHVFQRSYVVLRILRLMDGQRFVSSPQTSYRRSAALRRALALCSSLGQTRSTSWLVIFLYGGTADWSAIKKLHLSG